MFIILYFIHFSHVKTFICHMCYQLTLEELSELRKYIAVISVYLVSWPYKNPRKIKPQQVVCWTYWSTYSSVMYSIAFCTISLQVRFLNLPTKYLHFFSKKVSSFFKIFTARFLKSVANIFTKSPEILDPLSFSFTIRLRIGNRKNWLVCLWIKLSLSW